MRMIRRGSIRSHGNSLWRCGKWAGQASIASLMGLLGVWPMGAATFTVVNTNPSGSGSLVQAILDANANPGLDTIAFDLPGSGPYVISPASALPSITDPVILDGTTQPGYRGTPIIEVSGASATASAAGLLRVQAGGSTVRGLVLRHYNGTGLALFALGTNVVEGCYLGTDVSGTVAAPNSRLGIWISGSSGNRIGGPSAAQRNVISGNGQDGIFLDTQANANVIQGDFIGTTAAGTASLGNTGNGITLSAAGGNTIGGDAAGAGNLISGNGASGIYLLNTSATGNKIQGNRIGTDATGTQRLANGADGISLINAPGNTVGGTTPGARNAISGNTKAGVSLTGAGATSNLIEGNFIGTDPSGQSALGNGYAGVTLAGASANQIGRAADAPAGGNLISGNVQDGVFLTNSFFNHIEANLIGLDVSGANRLANGYDGVAFSNAGSNTVGGASAGAGNAIAGNTSYGIWILGASAAGNQVLGNLVGLDATGAGAKGNGLAGIRVESPANVIGGTATPSRNVISGNALEGVWLANGGAFSNVVQGNFIGTDANGSKAMPNLRAGVGISGAPSNTIGGATSGSRNLISGNGDINEGPGIYLTGAGAVGNQILGNRIGTDVSGGSSLANTHEGIYLQSAGFNTIGGRASGAGNVIAGNGSRGLFLNPGWSNVIQGNFIGVDAGGANALGNGTTILAAAVELETGSHDNLIGGLETGAGNRIGFAPSLRSGVRIRNGAVNNGILGNAIFSNAELGIDLGYGNQGTFGVTPNDACDADTGANMLQNFPVLAVAATSANGTGVRGSLNSTADTAFRLQFFASPACNALGYGEGQVYLGDQIVTTGPDCNASFTASFATAVSPGWVVTATATDPNLNTSEFSACVPVALSPSLSLSLAGSDQIQLAWPGSATGFVLKQTGSLAPPIQWTTVTNVPGQLNGQFVLKLPRPDDDRFYVLSFQ